MNDKAARTHKRAIAVVDRVYQASMQDADRVHLEICAPMEAIRDAAINSARLDFRASIAPARLHLRAARAEADRVAELGYAAAEAAYDKSIGKEAKP